MSKKYIGNTIDIHAGGEDLIFPHHENEIAQSEACNDEPFANYWMHNAFLNIDGEKMSKSAGNFFTVREIGEKYPLQVIRFFMLSAHYRSPLNFSDTLVESSKNGLERILTAIENVRDAAATNDGVLTDVDKENLVTVKELVAKYEAAMEDDFNTADAIAAIFEMVKLANITVKEGSKEYAQTLLETLEKLCDILGIITEKEEELLDADVEALIEERQAARKAKNFARADEIRDELAAQGIILKDTREGVKWTRA
jgi:cysteinyl-tRNA synthetase